MNADGSGRGGLAREDDAAEVEVDLALSPDFQLARLAVRPSAARVEADGRVQTVAPRVMQVLVALARRRGETVTRDQLADACWGGRIVSDDAVNRTIAQVRALARSFDPPPFTVETVSKVGFRLDADDEARPDPLAVAEAPAPAPRTRRWGLVGLVALGLALALAAWAVAEHRSRSAQSGRVEVVRFETPRPDPELTRLSGEIGESLVRNLSRSGIDTAPRVAERGDGGEAEGAELRVAGSVDRDADGLVVNSQIIDRRSGLVLLSIRLSRPEEAKAGLSEKTGLGIAAVLDCLLEDRRQSGRRFSPQVMALYLNTCDSIAREPRPQRMLEAARRLVRAAPDLAVGQALLAVALSAVADEPSRAPGEAAALHREARATAEKALRLDPRTPKAHLAIAINHRRGTDFAQREAHLTRAHEIDPNLNPGRIEYMWLLQEVGRVKEARAVTEQLLDSGDPRTSVFTLYPAATLAADAGDLSEARNLARQVQQQNPGFGGHVIAQIELWWAPPAEALALWRERAKGPHASPFAGCAVAWLEARVAGAALPPACAGLDPENQLRILGGEGDVDAAYAVLNRMRAAGPFNSSVLFERRMAAVRADPRFMPLARDLGLLDYWRSSGHWPDFCLAPDRPYDCARAAAGLPRAGR